MNPNWTDRDLRESKMAWQDFAAVCFCYAVVAGWLAVIGLAVFAGVSMVMGWLT